LGTLNPAGGWGNEKIVHHVEEELFRKSSVVRRWTCTSPRRVPRSVGSLLIWGWCGARYGSGSRRTEQEAGSATSTSTPPTSTSTDTAGHLPGRRHRGRCLRPRTARDPRHARQGQRVDRLLDRVPPKPAPTLSQPHQSYQAPL